MQNNNVIYNNLQKRHCLKFLLGWENLVDPYLSLGLRCVLCSPATVNNFRARLNADEVIK
ncbi:hypothetical protein T07_8115 [Trichinella nelsoni]|uniref:Uncharacterized protein n=1 Tax=Trichinella nelsoni TaxID=6336 RepID=A0A0V0S1M2_9BILA|nr:hypothetical protein T07_8115 [Trichinella nelsoni]